MEKRRKKSRDMLHMLYIDCIEQKISRMNDKKNYRKKTNIKVMNKIPFFSFHYAIKKE